MLCPGDLCEREQKTEKWCRHTDQYANANRQGGRYLDIYKTANARGTDQVSKHRACMRYCRWRPTNRPHALLKHFRQDYRWTLINSPQAMFKHLRHEYHWMNILSTGYVPTPQTWIPLNEHTVLRLCSHTSDMNTTEWTYCHRLCSNTSDMNTTEWTYCPQAAFQHLRYEYHWMNILSTGCSNTSYMNTTEWTYCPQAMFKWCSNTWDAVIKLFTGFVQTPGWTCYAEVWKNTLRYEIDSWVNVSIPPVHHALVTTPKVDLFHMVNSVCDQEWVELMVSPSLALSPSYQSCGLISSRSSYSLYILERGCCSEKERGPFAHCDPFKKKEGGRGRGGGGAEMKKRGKDEYW